MTNDDGHGGRGDEGETRLAAELAGARAELAELKRTIESLEERNLALQGVVDDASPGPDAAGRAGLDDLLEGCQIIGFDWRFLYLNDSAAAQGRIPREKFLGRTMQEVLPGVERTEMFGVLERCMKERRSLFFENEFLYADGSSGWFELRVRPHQDGIFLLSIDITERKRAERELMDSKAFVEAIVENVPLMIFLKDAKDLTFVLFNRAGEELLGHNREVFLGKNDADFFPAEQAASFTATDRAVLEGKFGTLDIPEETVLTATQEQRLLHTRKVCIRGADGTPKYLLGISEDITLRKRAEEERAALEAQLFQAQKMDSVGRLAGGVAHDFNNMLGVILGHTEMAMEVVAPGSPLHADLEEIRKAARRSADLTRQLLGFARRQTVTPRVLDLNDTVASILTMLGRLIGEHIRLAWLPCEGLWPLEVDPSQIDQVLTNLCVNARDAISGVGKLTIETRNVTLDERESAAHLGSVPGDYVRLSISDDGCGMDEETQAKLFEPFFTTKELGSGTGLGLATVYGIVKQNDGFIEVHSELGRGSTFNIFLPRYEGSVLAVRMNAPAEPSLRGRETILLVEDEEALLGMTRTMLEKSGYVVLTASTAGEAVRLAEAHAGEIHLLLTDVIMPEMNGRDLAKALVGQRPRLACLFMSGYTADVIAGTGGPDEDVNFIPKPFTIQALCAKVRQALDGNRTR
ncbi:MAG: PAS domain-containing protein [Myxococcales bacterium]|nr:PAS domain-containing protein [Myxococcales bacterium]